MLDDIQTECGVGAIVDPTGKNNVAPFVGPLLRKLEHRGSGACGSAWIDSRDEKICLAHREGRAREVFTSLHAHTHSSIVHTLYRTNPASKPHPYIAEYGGKRIAVAFNGNIPSTPQEKSAQDYLARRGNACETRSDTEMIGRLIAMHLADTNGNMRKVFEGLPEYLSNGAYNVVILHEENGHVHVLRDPSAKHPVVYGTTKAGLHVAASEDQALRSIWSSAREIDISRIKPGMMLHMGPGVMQPEVDQVHSPSFPTYCSFEWAYFADFIATLDGARVFTVRRKFGHSLAKSDEHDKKNWHRPVVVPIPDSARVAAEGYADLAQIPHVDALLKRQQAPRSFIATGDRAKILRNKFIFDYSMIAGRDVVLMDDSLVRGTTSREIPGILRSPQELWNRIREFATTHVPMLKRYGIRLHWRFAFPPVIAPCFHGMDFSTRDELYVPKFDSSPTPTGDVLSPKVLDAMAKDLGVSSVKFLSISAVHEAIGIPPEQLCRACFTGQYPNEATQELYQLQVRKRGDISA